MVEEGFWGKKPADEEESASEIGKMRYEMRVKKGEFEAQEKKLSELRSEISILDRAHGNDIRQIDGLKKDVEKWKDEYRSLSQRIVFAQDPRTPEEKVNDLNYSFDKHLDGRSNLAPSGVQRVSFDEAMKGVELTPRDLALYEKSKLSPADKSRLAELEQQIVVQTTDEEDDMSETDFRAQLRKAKSSNNEGEAKQQ